MEVGGIGLFSSKCLGGKFFGVMKTSGEPSTRILRMWWIGALSDLTQSILRKIQEAILSWDWKGTYVHLSQKVLWNHDNGHSYNPVLYIELCQLYEACSPVTTWDDIQVPRNPLLHHNVFPIQRPVRGYILFLDTLNYIILKSKKGMFTNTPVIKDSVTDMLIQPILFTWAWFLRILRTLLR